MPFRRMLRGTCCSRSRDCGPRDAAAWSARRSVPPGLVVAESLADSPWRVTTVVCEHKLANLVAAIDFLPSVLHAADGRSLGWIGVFWSLHLDEDV